jgi:hypothetical protein
MPTQTRVTGDISVMRGSIHVTENARFPTSTSEIFLNIVYNSTVNRETRHVANTQGGLYFQNVTRFRGTRGNLTLFTTVSKALPSLQRFVRKSLLSNKFLWISPHRILSKREKKKKSYKIPAKFQLRP